MISASPRAASRAYRPPRCALCQEPQSSATRPKGGSPCQKRRLVGPQTTVARTPIKPAKPSLARFSTAARPNTRCKRSASVICGRHARGELFDSHRAPVQRLSMRRVAAASNKLQPQRCEHERPATPRGGSERPRTRAPTRRRERLRERSAETRKKLTACPPQVSHRNHSAPKTIAVVPKASCVGSTAI